MTEQGATFAEQPADERCLYFSFYWPACAPVVEAFVALTRLLPPESNLRAQLEDAARTIRKMEVETQPYAATVEDQHCGFAIMASADDVWRDWLAYRRTIFSVCTAETVREARQKNRTLLVQTSGERHFDAFGDLDASGVAYRAPAVAGL